MRRVVSRGNTENRPANDEAPTLLFYSTLIYSHKSIDPDLSLVSRAQKEKTSID